jgi:hypothetical protein
VGELQGGNEHDDDCGHLSKIPLSTISALSGLSCVTRKESVVGGKADMLQMAKPHDGLDEASVMI